MTSLSFAVVLGVSTSLRVEMSSAELEYYVSWEIMSIWSSCPKFKHKKGACKKWKQDQVPQKESRDAIQP